MGEELSPGKRGMEWVLGSIPIGQDVPSTQRGHMLSMCLCCTPMVYGLTQTRAEAKSPQSSQHLLCNVPAQ